MSKIPKPVNLDKILASINKGFKEPIAAPLSEGIRSDVKNVIPTGIPAIDNYVLGVGGLPCGRMTELFANEGVGKTSLALQAMASAQKQNSVVFLAETECALQSERPAVFGVDWNGVIKLEPGHWIEVMEQTQACLEAMPKTHTGLFVLDSVAATLDKDEAHGLVPKKEALGRRAAAISNFMRRLGPLAVDKQVAFLFINQVRANIGVFFGPDTTTPGGHAMKFHSSLRLCMYQGASIKGTRGQHLGKYCSVQAVKNKFVPPWRKAKLKLDFASGWDPEWATLNHAKELKFLPPRAKKVEEALELLELNGWDGSKASDLIVEEQDEFDVDES